MKISLPALIIALLLGLNLKVFAQPTNNECAGAISLGTLPAPGGACSGGFFNGAPTVISATSVSSTGANPYTFISGCNGVATPPAPAKDVWYSFVASGYTVNITVSGGTLGAAYIALYEGTCGNLRGRGCAVGTGATTSLQIGQIVIGQTYYIQISGATATAEGTFNLSVENDNDCNPCLVQSTITASPQPVNGAYEPGQVVDFCFRVDRWTIQATNWFHGVQVAFGNGYSGISNQVAAASCDGGGTWKWTNGNVTGNSGVTFGPGWYYDRDNDNLFNDGYGDNCQGPGRTWTFCFRLTVRAACTPGSDLSVTINTTGDGESGSWSSVACNDDLATRFFAVGSCCPPTMTSTPTCPAPSPLTGSVTATPVGTQGPYTYSWTNGTSSISTSSGVAGANTVSNLAPGTYTVFITDKNNCRVDNTVTVAANAVPTVTAGNNGPICAGASANLTSGGANTYSWSTGALTSSTSVSPATTTTYTVFGTSASGCVDDATTSVTVNNAPTAALVGGGSICNGSALPLTVNFTGTGPWNLVYNNGTTNQTVNNIASTPYTINASTAGTYTLVSVSNAQCSGTVSGSAVVAVNTSPTAAISGGGSICADGSTASISVALTGTGPWIIRYSDGTNNTTVPGISSSPYIFTTSTAGTYVLTDVSDANCSGTVSGSAVVIVNPIPSVNNVSPVTYCNGQSTAVVAISGPVTGTTFAWTNSNSTIGLAASGSGNIPSFTATNTGNATISSNIIITPTANGCTGPTNSFTITVNPTPTVNAVNDVSYCNGDNVTSLTLGSTIGGATFNWTNSNTSIGLAASGSGNIPSYTAVNIGSSPVTATVSITATANTCVGPAETYIVTVKPTPTLNPTPADAAYCNGATASAVNLSGPVAGTTFSWTNNNTAIGLGANGSASVPSFTAVNTGTTASTATVTINLTADGCPGTPLTYNYTINPTPRVNALNDLQFCNGNSTSAVNLSSTPTGASIAWTNTNTAIGLAASGSGSIPSFTASNTTSAVITATITLTPTLNGCSGPDSTFTITVSPSPVIDNVPNQLYCNGNLTSQVVFNTTPTGSTFAWTNSNPSITGSLGASGTGNINSYTATNTTAVSAVSNFTVTPTLNGCVGNPETYTVTVNPQPLANAGSNQDICLGETANLTGSGGTSCVWSPLPSGGNTCTTTTSPLTTTIYTLIVTDANSCSDTTSVRITVHANPTVDFSSTGVCLGGTTQFTNLSSAPAGESITSQSWLFESGANNSSSNPAYLFSSCGLFPVKLVVTSNFGCADSITKNATVFCLPTADFTVLEDTLCSGETAVFNNNSSASVAFTNNWSFGTGQGSSTASDPSYQYNNPGTYGVSLIVTTTEGCSDTSLTVPVFVINSPIPNFTANQVCLNSPTLFNNLTQANGNTGLTYVWDFDDGTLDVTEDPTHTYSSYGLYNVSLSVNSAEGCSNDTTIVVEVFPIPFADFTATAVCLGLPTTFTVTNSIASSSYVWDFQNNGTTDATGNPVTFTASQAGTDSTKLTVTNINGCSSTITKAFTVNALPSAGFTANITNGCEPLRVNFTDTTNIPGTTIVAWTWSLGNGAGGNASSVSATYNAGIYNVQLVVVTNFGCTDTIRKLGYIESYPTPTANFNYTPDVIQESNGVVLFNDLSIGNIVKWNWDFGDTTESNLSGIQNPVHIYSDTGTYCVDLRVATDKGCVDSITKCLKVLPEFIIYIPNSFTPNEDGINEKFFPKGRGFLTDEDYELIIYDRWGNLIYRSTKYSDTWDGTHQQDGSICQMDTYIYRINVMDVFSKKHQFTGQVHLVR